MDPNGEQTKKKGSGLHVLAEATEALDAAGADYVVIGSIAAAALGKADWPNVKEDIDLLVRDGEGERIRDVLVAAGFEPDDSGPDWLVKAWKDGIMVDVIFQPSGGQRLDDEMLARAVLREFKGVRLRLTPPEDFVVMQALTYGPETWQQLFNGAGVLERSPIDWPYLQRRARLDPPRVLSLLLYALAEGIRVPHDVLDDLASLVVGRTPQTRAPAPAGAGPRH